MTSPSAPVPPNAAGLVVWPLMPLNYVLCAAPAYLAQQGVPATLTELTHHHCIINSQDSAAIWRFRGSNGETEVAIEGRLRVNNVMLRCDAARAGAGVLLCAEYLVESDIANGRLVRLLPDYAPAGENLYAVCPAYRASSARVRSLVTHLTRQLGE